jgi:hypothetical protein
MRTRILSAMMILFILLISSCNQQKTINTSETNVQEEIVMNKQDTIKALSLVSDFLEALKEKKYADAVLMLHEVNPENCFAEPVLLDNEKIEEAMQTLKQYPIKNYSIRDYQFKYTYDNTVRCVIEVEKKEGNTQKMTFALKPVRYLGQWSLCLRD